MAPPAFISAPVGDWLMRLISFRPADRPADAMTAMRELEAALEGPERRIIESALQRNDWNRQATAAELDINRTTLYKKMRKYRLDIGETNAA